MFPWACASSDACFIDGRVSNLGVVHRAMSAVPHIYALLWGGAHGARVRCGEVWKKATELPSGVLPVCWCNVCVYWVRLVKRTCEKHWNATSAIINFSTFHVFMSQSGLSYGLHVLFQHGSAAKNMARNMETVTGPIIPIPSARHFPLQTTILATHRESSAASQQK
jgi:hypothetical protein